MSRHTSYRGTTIDMDTMRRENEKATALGNMGVNARGDQVGRASMITKSADQLARENHRVQTTIINTGLKGAVPESAATRAMLTSPPPPVAATIKKVKEKELPSGDIIVENDDDATS